MGGITPLLTTALPAATSLVNGVSRISGSSSSSSAASSSAASAQQEAARLEAERQALERKYQEERAAEERRYTYEQQVRQETARQQQEAQVREWARQDELRRQEQELQRQKDEEARIASEQSRSREMEWLTRGQNQEGTQLRANQEAALRTQETDAQTRLAQLAATAEADEKRRVDALRRTMARSRASMGANGVSAADGSGEAILLGLVNDTDGERQDARKIDQIKRQAIQQEVDSVRRRNLLEQAQLAERQRLEFLSKFY